MEATFCLSRHLCTKPIFTKPCNRPTIQYFHVNLNFHRHRSLPGRTLQSWPTQKAHRKMLAVNASPAPQNGGNGRDNQTDKSMGTNERAFQALSEASETELQKAKRILAKTRIEFPDLEEVAQSVKMSHQAGEIIKALREKYDTFDKGTQEAHELGLILAEQLIYQGEYNEAIILVQNDYPSVLKGATQGDPNSSEVPVERVLGPSDARPELYLAAAYMLLGHEREAEKRWREFKEKAEGFFMPPVTDGKDDQDGGRPPQSKFVEFKEFGDRMKKLKLTIEAARKRRSDGNSLS